MPNRDLHVAVYGDLNLNIIDGSSIWLQSLCRVLSLTRRARVTVLLKASEERDLLTAPLRSIEHVTLLNPHENLEGEGELSHQEALHHLAELDKTDPVDAFVFRGYKLCQVAAVHESETFQGRMFPYLTDIPQHWSAITDRDRTQIGTITEASRFIFCQTEALRCFMESNFDGVAGKAMLLPPMIPEHDKVSPPNAVLGEQEPLRLVYVGKFAPKWYTLEMTRAIAELRADGIAIELNMVGDKVHRDRHAPDFHDEMQTALRSGDGVLWHGAKSRDETLTMLGGFHVALGWRHPDLDASLELSTKLLEYGYEALPVIVNRNPMHEELLGADYPLFASDASSFKTAVVAARSLALRQRAAESTRAAAQAYTFSAVAKLVDDYLERAVPVADLRGKQKRNLRVLVACHDFKFFTRIQEHLASVRGVDLRVDRWPAIDKHDPDASQTLLEWADVIICEWFCHNAIWYSHRKRENQKLIVRLHRFELYGQYPKRANIEGIDHVVFVGDFYRDEAVSRLSWPQAKLEVIPNWVDDKLMNRSKVPGAFFNLGMIGIAPKRKRLDRGVEILRQLRRVDRRFQLYIKSKLPWEYPWIWQDLKEQEHYARVFRQINNTEELRGAVHFDPFGPEVGAWLRKVGFVLSTSDDESFHLAPAEGMASGALPMLLDWQGVDAIYPEKWIHRSCDEIAETILKTLHDDSWSTLGDEVKGFITDNYSIRRVCNDWERLVTQ